MNNMPLYFKVWEALIYRTVIIFTVNSICPAFHIKQYLLRFPSVVGGTDKIGIEKKKHQTQFVCEAQFLVEMNINSY